MTTYPPLVLLRGGGDLATGVAARVWRAGFRVVVTEIERYIVNPGQACAYKVGQLEILALRERARDRQGPRFDIRKFHDVVLTNGALPMSLLAQVVDEWIAAELRASATRAKG